MKSNSKCIKIAVLLLLFGLIIPLNAGAENLKIGAMRLGTSWYVFGASFAKIFQEVLPPGSNVEVIARGGGVANPVAVNQGKVGLGIATVATSVWALNGHPVVYKGTKYPDIRALVGGLNSIWVTAMMTEDYIKKTGNDTLEKALLATKDAPRIAMKPAGSSIPVVVDMLFEAIGTNREKIESHGGKIIQVGASQIPGLLRDGRADLYFEGATAGHPAITEASLTTELRFMDFPDDALAKLSKEGLNPLPMPKFFKGQTGPTKAVDLGNLLIVNKDMSEEMAYLLTKTICENKETLGEAHKALKNFDPKLAGTPGRTGIPLHPGALKYYKEQGWL
jgi:TRAP transporter TAXI family solute receptor